MNHLHEYILEVIAKSDVNFQINGETALSKYISQVKLLDFRIVRDLVEAGDLGSISKVNKRF